MRQQDSHSWQGYYPVKLKLIGTSLSEPHTSVPALRTHVCMLVCLFVCLDRPLIVKFKWVHSNYFTMMECPHRHILQWTTEQKPWKWAWKGTARLQGCREREQEWRRFKPNALAACMAILWAMVWFWRLHDKAGYEWPWLVTVRQ